MSIFQLTFVCTMSSDLSTSPPSPWVRDHFLDPIWSEHPRFRMPRRSRANSWPWICPVIIEVGQPPRPLAEAAEQEIPRAENWWHIPQEVATDELALQSTPPRAPPIVPTYLTFEDFILNTKDRYWTQRGWVRFGSLAHAEGRYTD